MTRQELNENILKHFDIAEIRSLCFTLSINYEDLTGDTRMEKILALILHCEHHSKLDSLIKLCKKLRPNSILEKLLGRSKFENIPEDKNYTVENSINQNVKGDNAKMFGQVGRDVNFD